LGARYTTDVGDGQLGLQADLTYKAGTPDHGDQQPGVMPDDIERRLERARSPGERPHGLRPGDKGLRLSLWSQNIFNVKYGYKGISPNFTAGIGHVNPRRRAPTG